MAAVVVDRLVDDAWVAVAMFLSHRALLVLSLASRGLRRTALSNGIWEWVLRRDFSKRIVQAAEQAPLWWIPAGGMPAATDERQFVRCYFRLLRSTPPRSKDVHPLRIATMDSMLRLAATRWRPVAQVALLVGGIGGETTQKLPASWGGEGRPRPRRGRPVPVAKQAGGTQTGEEDATGRLCSEAADAYLRAPYFVIRLLVTSLNGLQLFYVPVDVMCKAFRDSGYANLPMVGLLRDDPERLQCMSTEEQLELIDRKLDPLLGYALACQRLRERRLNRAWQAVGASMYIAVVMPAIVGMPVAGYRPFNIAILEQARWLLVHCALTVRNACLVFQDWFVGERHWMPAVDATPAWQWNAEDVLTYLRGNDQAQMVAMLDVLASMSQPLRAALPIGAIGVATAAVAVSCGYAQVASQDPDVRRLVSYINGPTVPLLLSALMAGGAEFVQAWVLYSPQIYMPFARTVFFAARSFAVALSTPIFLSAVALLFVQCFLRRNVKDAFATLFFGGLASFTGALRVFDAWLTPLLSQLCATWLPGEHGAIAARLFVSLALQLLIEVGVEGYYARPLTHVLTWPFRQVGVKKTLLEHQLAQGFACAPAAARRRHRWHGLAANAASIVVLMLTGSAVRAAAAKATASVALALLHHLGRTLAYARFGL
jgi:hypothetical protein